METGRPKFGCLYLTQLCLGYFLRLSQIDLSQISAGFDLLQRWKELGYQSVGFISNIN